MNPARHVHPGRCFPPDWCAEDPSRGPKAGVSEGAAFAPQARFAQAMLERSFAAGVPAAWVCCRALPVSRGQALPPGLRGPAGSPDQGV
jgi:hypothetical protein